MYHIFITIPIASGPGTFPRVDLLEDPDVSWRIVVLGCVWVFLRHLIPLFELLGAHLVSSYLCQCPVPMGCHFVFAEQVQFRPHPPPKYLTATLFAFRMWKVLAPGDQCKEH